MTVKVKRCPICKAAEFHVHVTVSQTWKVGATGNFLHAVTTSDSIERRPTDEDDWTCAKCGYVAKGRDFNLYDKPIGTLTMFAKMLDGDAREIVVPIEVELFERDVVPMTGIMASVKDWLKTPEGQLHNDESDKVTFRDLHKIPEEIFRQHGIRVKVHEPVDALVPYDMDLKGLRQKQ